MEITLSAYGSAVFKATENFHKPNPFFEHCEKSSIRIKEREFKNGKWVERTYISANPEYTKEMREEYRRKQAEFIKERDEFIYQYLLMNYPDTNYAMIYIAQHTKEE